MCFLVFQAAPATEYIKAHHAIWRRQIAHTRLPALRRAQSSSGARRDPRRQTPAASRDGQHRRVRRPIFQPSQREGIHHIQGQGEHHVGMDCGLSREILEYTSIFETLDHMAARKDQLREPVEGNEVLRVIQRRLMDKEPEEAVASVALPPFRRLSRPRATPTRELAEQQQAEQEGIELRDRIRAAYPFHRFATAPQARPSARAKQA